jgi:purine-binding chemotaxis protein CheW
VVGILADKVYDVTDIEPSAIEEAPRVGMRWRPDYVRGIGKRQGSFIIIPDLGRIFETQGRRSAPSPATEQRAAL